MYITKVQILLGLYTAGSIGFFVGCMWGGLKRMEEDKKHEI